MSKKYNGAISMCHCSSAASMLTASCRRWKQSVRRTCYAVQNNRQRWVQIIDGRWYHHCSWSWKPKKGGRKHEGLPRMHVCEPCEISLRYKKLCENWKGAASAWKEAVTKGLTKAPDENYELHIASSMVTTTPKSVTFHLIARQQ